MADAHAGATMAPTSNQNSDEKTLAILLHVLGIFTGFIAPLVIWLVKKDTSPFIDQTGRKALNWWFSAMIYYAACVVMIFTIILIPVAFLGFAALGILALVFCILGAVAASRGQVYKYPLSIQFLK